MPAIDAQWAVVAAGVAGLLIGSFLNVVIYRLPRMLERQWQLDAADLRGETIATTARFDLIQPRSHCPACGQVLRLRDLIPVASWLVLRGRCAACRAPIGTRYPLVELATAALFALCVVRFGPTVAAVSAMLLAAALIAGMAAPAGPVSAWAIRSVSTSVAPRAAKRSATVDLPLPMPPVRPMMNREEMMVMGAGRAACWGQPPSSQAVRAG